jgi:hypothetical protein
VYVTGYLIVFLELSRIVLYIKEIKELVPYLRAHSGLYIGLTVPLLCAESEIKLVVALCGEPG